MKLKCRPNWSVCMCYGRRFIAVDCHLGCRLVKYNAGLCLVTVFEARHCGGTRPRIRSVIPGRVRAMPGSAILGRNRVVAGYPSHFYCFTIYWSLTSFRLQIFHFAMLHSIFGTKFPLPSSTSFSRSVTSTLTSFCGCHFIFIIFTYLVIYYSFTISFRAQILFVPQFFPPSQFGGYQNSPSYRVGQKIWHHFFLYALTLPNINRFSKLFHCQNQEKICNNNVTKNPNTPQVCLYTTLWNVSVLKATIVNKTSVLHILRN